MNEKDITELVTSSAMDDAASELRELRSGYLNATRINGCAVKITLDKDKLETNLFDLLEFVNTQILDRRESIIKSQAVNKFLKDFNNFRTHINKMENY